MIQHLLRVFGGADQVVDVAFDERRESREDSHGVAPENGRSGEARKNSMDQQGERRSRLARELAQLADVAHEGDVDVAEHHRQLVGV
ncbi:MAG: hypothetical protein RIF41_36425, partial [Polyangiaceae bacterium]